MGERAGSVAPFYDTAHIGEPDEPVQVFMIGSGATGLGSSRRPEEGLRYSWLADYLERLDGKEARRIYYSWLE